MTQPNNPNEEDIPEPGIVIKASSKLIKEEHK